MSFRTAMMFGVFLRVTQAHMPPSVPHQQITDRTSARLMEESWQVSRTLLMCPISDDHPSALLIAVGPPLGLSTKIAALIRAGFNVHIYHSLGSDAPPFGPMPAAVASIWHASNGELRHTHSAGQPISVKPIPCTRGASEALKSVLHETRPTLVLPVYHDGLVLMHDTARSLSNPSSDADVVALRALQCSLPLQTYWTTTVSKSSLTDFAGNFGIRSPRKLIGSAQALAKQAADTHLTFPLMVKTDNATKDGNGRGVRYCGTPQCIEQVTMCHRRHRRMAMGKCQSKRTFTTCDRCSSPSLGAHGVHVCPRR